MKMNKILILILSIFLFACHESECVSTKAKHKICEFYFDGKSDTLIVGMTTQDGIPSTYSVYSSKDYGNRKLLATYPVKNTSIRFLGDTIIDYGRCTEWK